MKLHVFAVKDRATDAFGAPMFMVAAGAAIRSFSDECNRAATDNAYYQHPDDFDLYTLGEFETGDGQFVVHLPVLLIRGKDVKSTSEVN